MMSDGGCDEGGPSAQLAWLFPAGVAVRSASITNPDPNLFPEELLHIAASVPKRRREFAWGRAVARAALAELGISPAAIPVREDRDPSWPNGTVGSISHTEGLCCAAAATSATVRGLGLDVEMDGAVDATVARLVFSADELQALGGLRHLSLDRALTVGFSAKEAFYKCYFPIFRRRLEFRDAALLLSISPRQEAGAFRVLLRETGGWFDPSNGNAAGRWLISDGYVFCGFSWKA